MRSISNFFDFPSDVTSTLPKIEVLGNKFVRILELTELVFFSSNKIIYDTSNQQIVIIGQNLLIDSLAKENSLVSGKIEELKFITKESSK